MSVLQKLGGWSTLAMVQRYAHLATDHLVEYAEKISGTNRTHPENANNMKAT